MKLYKFLETDICCCFTTRNRRSGLVALSYKILQEVPSKLDMQCKGHVFFIGFCLVFYPSWYCPFRTDEGKGVGWWWWWWWCWWIALGVWLTDEKCLALFPFSEILTITNLLHAASRIWTYTKPVFRLSWTKLWSSNNHYTMAPQNVLSVTKVICMK